VNVLRVICPSNVNRLGGNKNDGFDEAIEASSWGQHDNIFTLIEPVGRDLDGRGFRLQRGLVPTDDGEELTQVRHRDGGGSEAQIW